MRRRDSFLHQESDALTLLRKAGFSIGIDRSLQNARGQHRITERGEVFKGAADDFLEPPDIRACPALAVLFYEPVGCIACLMRSELLGITSVAASGHDALHIRDELTALGLCHPCALILDQSVKSEPPQSPLGANFLPV